MTRAGYKTPGVYGAGLKVGPGGAPAVDVVGRPGRRMQLDFSDEEDDNDSSQFQDAIYTQQPKEKVPTPGRKQKVKVRYMSPEWEVDGEDQTDVPWLKESRSTCVRLDGEDVPYWVEAVDKEESK